MVIKNILQIFKVNKFIKQGVTFTLFATINNGLNFLLIFVLSIYLTKEDFGILNLFNIFILIISVVISLGTQSYFSVLFFQKTRKYLNKILNSILIISTITFLVLGIIIFSFSSILTSILGFSTLYQLYGLIICFFQLFYTINLEIYRLEEKPIQYGLMTLVWIIINFLITIYFCISLKYGWTGRVDAQILASILLFVINIFLLKKNRYLKVVSPSKVHYSKTLKFGLPLIPHNSTVWIRQGFDRYIINFFHGAVLVGAYSFAYTFSGIIMMIGTAFNATNSVYIFQNLKKTDIETSKKILSKQIYIMSIIFLIMTLAGIIVGYLLVLFAIPKYYDSLQFMIPLCIAAFFQCIYYLFVNYLLYFNRTKTLMYITFSISILHFMISFYVTRFSVVYTAYLNLVSNLFICIFVIYYTNKTFPLFNFKKIFNFDVLNNRINNE